MTDTLAKIQRALKAPKDKENKFGGYAYRNAEGILHAFKAIAPDGVALTMSDDVRTVGNTLFLVATVTLHEAGQPIATATGAAMHALDKKGMDAAQITGACSSYARKYALCGLFAIDDSADDPDGKDNRSDQPQFNSAAARDRIKGMVEKAQNLPRLKEIWDGEADTMKALSKPHFNELKKAFSDRKAALTPADPAMQAPHEYE